MVIFSSLMLYHSAKPAEIRALYREAIPINWAGDQILIWPLSSQ
jgi:hypothetical protein